MKKVFILLALLQLTAASLHAQKNTDGEKSLKESLTLKIDREGGANGANIAWHPGLKRYYAAMAGNATFPMEIFDEKGKMLSPDNLETMFDVRGLWYNPGTKTLQANGYDNGGWSEYKLDAKGIPVSSRKLSVITSQPDPQSVGVFDPKKKVLYFYDNLTVGVEQHNFKEGGIDSTIKLYLGVRKKDDISSSDIDNAKNDYNENAIIYTGVPKGEIGMLNVVKKQIELYNLATGLMTSVLKLPDTAPVQSSLNFSCSNGIYWLFDKSERTWHGYKL